MTVPDVPYPQAADVHQTRNLIARRLIEVSQCGDKGPRRIPHFILIDRAPRYGSSGVGDIMEYGRLVSVKPPSRLGDAEPVVFVVAAEDPDAALKLVADKVVIGSDMKIVGRASRRPLDALGLKPGRSRPRLRSQARRAPHPAREPSVQCAPKGAARTLVALICRNGTGGCDLARDGSQDAD